MNRRKLHPVLWIVIGLAVLGIGASLFQDPSGFITSIFVTVGIITIFILLFRKFIQPRLMQRQSGFQVPVKNGRPQPKAKTKPQPASQTRFKTKTKSKARRSAAPLKTVKQEKSRPKPLVKRQSDVKLTVIEGKKNPKKKSRALF